MTYSVVFKPSAEKAFSKLPNEIQKRLYAAACDLAENPRPPGFKKLHGVDDLYRIRVGDYRMVYTIEDCQLKILVVAIGHRREIYR
ncbi:type II toxin-antitoxin system RelE/ParE family toxin [Methylomonas sp. EFPC3]|uniref:Type II toxin-antitoxin system RelE/ParE family toxin n=1 Tax=Methylomonas aurea TaxID=2952224 RepID=A0ABT1UJJ9_9GAMM|nr:MULTISPECIES: type II toxin-antitoxin system RelE/ParE family toxin [unclassified Methylomonas]MCQ8181864.1 type II toxin-antitoxin system RelE/ParE family toxin [Methylomonas sp. SURF-1]WFP51981.1 type II toxin-antitoxin system RelE/ParE family toxin [Methylomonas sp. EFPC3]